MATSRIPPRVPGESDWRVPSLSLPGTDAPGQIARSDACSLFAERAAKVSTDFAFSSDNAAIVARICRDLDGLPLAIELAAARASVLPALAEGDGFRRDFWWDKPPGSTLVGFDRETGCGISQRRRQRCGAQVK